MKKTYHSALHKPLEINKKLDRYQTEKGTTLTHDLTDGIPEDFNAAECIFSEPAWRDGYLEFGYRADKLSSSFNQYLHSIKILIARLDVPTYMVIGKHMVKRLQPEETKVIKLHGYECVLGLWNIVVSEEFEDNYSVMDYVAQNHNNILDFSCGYGNIVETALKHGKKFIAADINAECTYYIAKKYMGYEG